MIKIDAHHHFWNYHPGKHSWINEEMAVLKQDFLPNDLFPILNQNNFQGCVSIQADQSEVETDFLLACAHEHEFILGVVGWIDLKSDSVADRLEYYSRNPLLKGWRHVIQDEVDPGFILNEKFLNGISLLFDYNHTYDILVYPSQLDSVLTAVKMFPNQKFVIDHIAKPNISDGKIDGWRESMEELGALDNIWCKISGLVTEANWDSWDYRDFVAYLKIVIDAFGFDKLMFGSDWPVCNLAAPYSGVVSIPEAFIYNHSLEEKTKFWSGNAIEFYNL